MQIFADAAVDFPTAGDVFRAPLVEDVVHYFLDVIKIHFGLERVVHAVVPGVEQLFVIHLRVVAKMRVARGFDKPVGHERAR